MITSGDGLRTYYAAERTLLAWVRTGTSVIGLGFVVARFGLFLRIVAAQNSIPVDPHPTPNYLGVALVFCGASGIALAVYQHARNVTSMPLEDRPDALTRNWPLIYSSCIALVGIAMAAYLLVRMV